MRACLCCLRVKVFDHPALKRACQSVAKAGNYQHRERLFVTRLCWCREKVALALASGTHVGRCWRIWWLGPGTSRAGDMSRCFSFLPISFCCACHRKLSLLSREPPRAIQSSKQPCGKTPRTRLSSSRWPRGKTSRRAARSRESAAAAHPQAHVRTT